jgi:hypothetical protein
LLTLVWGIDGFHIADLMTEQHSYNTQYFLSHTLEPLLLAVFSDGRKPHSRRLSLHFNNCRVHRSKASSNFFTENSIILLPHPPSSPDLTPSDFWLFRQMKAAWQDNSWPGERIFSLAFRNF